MKSRNLSVVCRVRAGLVGGVIAATLALSAQAVDLPFSDSTGFSASATATVVQLIGGGAPLAGFGGLEFSTAILTPPGAPIGDGTVPPNIWQGVAWGCQLFNASASTCANGGVIGNGINFPDPSANPDRSSLRVEGKAGLLTDAGWTDVTVVTHFNKIISDRSNVLKTVDILSKFRLGTGEIPSAPIKVIFTETPNDIGPCVIQPVPVNGGTNAPPINPLGGQCDDFAIVSGIDLASVFVPAGALGNPGALFVDFRLFATPGAGAMVCDGSVAQPALCGGYNGSDIVIYTAENSTNSLSLQARLRPVPVNIALFVIGDVEPHAIGNVVNFWGAQWWKNNFMSGFVSKGVASFKGYASSSDNVCGGTWTSRPGNSSVPPATIPDDVAIIVTSTVLKDGPNISGNIKQILIVHHDGNYGPAPGHRGSGPVTSIICTQP